MPIETGKEVAHAEEEELGCSLRLQDMPSGFRLLVGVVHLMRRTMPRADEAVSGVHGRRLEVQVKPEDKRKAGVLAEGRTLRPTLQGADFNPAAVDRCSIFAPGVVALTEAEATLEAFTELILAKVALWT